MNSYICIPLDTTSEQFQQLLALQSAFAQVCNTLTPEVQKSRIWNRVTLHHLHYRSLRREFPALGSQMVCNAIYAVSKTARLIFQAPASPFSLGKLGGNPLPLLKFSNSCPVYFDWHTLSIKGTKLSLFTLDGRMHFELMLAEPQLLLFKLAKLREISLLRKIDGVFELNFSLEFKPEQEAVLDFSEYLKNQLPPPIDHNDVPHSIIPDYVSVEVAA
jgi:hypothetical protein